MSRSFLAALAGVGCAMCAGAADAQSAAPAAGDWSGVYFGLNGGWNWARVSRGPSAVTVNQLSGVSAGAGPVSVPATTVTAARTRASDNDVQGGGQVGLNAVAGPVILGLEGDFDGMRNEHRSIQALSLPATALTTGSSLTAVQTSEPLWAASIRGRLGVAAGPALVYATGGPAWVQLRQTTTFNYAPTVTGAVAAANPGTSFGPVSNFYEKSRTRQGWTVGGGAEFMHSAHMTVGVEYRHTWADGFRNEAPGAPARVFETGRSRFRDDSVLARINVKFGAMPKIPMLQ